MHAGRGLGAVRVVWVELPVEILATGSKSKPRTDAPAAAGIALKSDHERSSASDRAAIGKNAKPAATGRAHDQILPPIPVEIGADHPAAVRIEVGPATQMGGFNKSSVTPIEKHPVALEGAQVVVDARKPGVLHPELAGLPVQRSRCRKKLTLIMRP